MCWICHGSALTSSGIRHLLWCAPATDNTRSRDKSLLRSSHVWECERRTPAKPRAGESMIPASPANRGSGGGRRGGAPPRRRRSTYRPLPSEIWRASAANWRRCRGWGARWACSISSSSDPGSIGICS